MSGNIARLPSKRVWRVLDFLCRTPESMTITEICHSLDYSSGEIFRILQVLEDHNFIRKGKGDTGYELTNRLFLLAMERPANRNLVEVGPANNA